MLDKKICKICFKDNKKKWDSYVDFLWERENIICCPVNQPIRAIKEMPDMKCVYRLEQLVGNGC